MAPRVPGFLRGFVNKTKGKRRRQTPALLRHASASSNMDGEKIISITESLPVEILTQIFDHLRPPFHVPALGQLSIKYHEYMINLGQLATLRVVCKIWNQTLIPVIHREVVIPTLSLYKVKKGLLFLNHCEDVHIKSLVFCDLKGRYWTPGEHYTEIRRLFGTQLRDKLANANIEYFACYSRTIEVLASPEWLPQILPKALLTVESLTMNYSEQDKVLLALKQLGGKIKTLEIQHWYSDATHPSGTDFPDEMPQLTHVTLSNSGPDREDLLKLFSCVGSLVSGGPSSPSASLSPVEGTSCTKQFMTSNLKSLVLEHVNSLYADQIVTILRINSIGETLTSLTVEPSNLQGWSWRAHDATRIIELCPSLVKLRFTPPIHEAFLNSLPSTLRNLSLFMYPNNFDTMHNVRLDGCITSPVHFIQLLSLPQVKIDTLTVLVTKPYWQKTVSRPGLGEEALMNEQLEVACRTAGVFLKWDCISTEGIY